MTKVALSPKASAAAGAIFTYLRPRLAQDAQIDLKACLLPMKGGKSFHDAKPAIANAMRSITRGKLAQDADIDDVAALLDAIENVVESPGEAVPEGMGEENGEIQMPDEEVPPMQPDDDAHDDEESPDMMAKIRDFIAAHVDEDTLAQFDQLVGSGGEEQPEEMPEMEGKEEEDEEMSRDSKGPVMRPAMDAAIRDAVAQERATQRAIQAAYEHVRPSTGSLDLAFDSAEDVYKTALKHAGVKVDGVHPSAFKPMFEMHVTASKAAPRRERIAQDTALPQGVKSLSERFPGASRIGTM